MSDDVATEPQRAGAQRIFLFVMWQGGGNVPVQLGVARRLVEGGHRVRVLADPAGEGEARATGSVAPAPGWAQRDHGRPVGLELDGVGGAVVDPLLVGDQQLVSPS